MQNKSIAVALMVSGLFATHQAAATERLYGVIGAGYSQSEFRQGEQDGLSYKAAIGYQLDAQWYLEAGYQRIADGSVDVPPQSNESDALAGDALSLSVLGKAGSREGELFYRLGILRGDLEGYQTVTQDGVDGLVYYNDSVVAGTVGLGFDWYVGLNSMIRFEFEHIFGEDDLKVNAATIGFRYNFN
ncbi:outer membrane beta-barrel protein [Alteromonas oceanisediminis]|uniref:outer membrane beta-barrel protein n=1 Tax=Alteromonas oceanisediminis TaxID=2836180 RepID=UPI001BDB684E|nr:outer membrane beta-barrel protein [Alteromonas oceanisediminis]MBT0585647.1 outer membrane beta-barrel protein [Alteromonas oceanisediminis]